MFQKYSVLIGILIAMLLLVVATFYYPGGSQHDATATGFAWQHNYLCNLFNEKAVNGKPNPPRPLAIIGLFFLCASIALFFYRFSQKIDNKTASQVIKYAGVGAMFFTAFIFTEFHDLITIISSTLGLLALFYILVFIYKSKLQVFKLLCLMTIVLLYVNNYIYYSQQGLYFLPVLQKISLLLVSVLIVCLDYFTTKNNFMTKKPLF